MSNQCNSCNDTAFSTISKDPTLIDLLSKSSKKQTVLGDNISIFVDRIETENEVISTVNYVPYIDLIINTFTNDVNLILKGTTISTLNLSWQYNKSIQSHSLNQGLTAPAVISGQTLYNLNLTGLNLNSTTTYTLTADDLTSDNINPISKSTTVSFGNNIYHGSILIDNTDLYDPIENDIKSLTNIQLSANASSINNIEYTNNDVDLYYIVALPASFNFNSFKDSNNPLPGGFEEIKRLNITNSENFSEEYIVFRSTYDNLAGVDLNNNPITFSII